MDRVKAGRWMRLQRERRHVTEKQVALGAGVSRTSVWKWESGQRLPSCEHFILWAHAVRMAPADAIAGFEMAGGDA